MDLAAARSFYCAPYGLRGIPTMHAEVSYNDACVNGPHHAPYFDLIAYNARDFNLNYIYVSYATRAT